MISRPNAIAAARMANGAFFIAVAAYCFLACSPFAYELFIRPSVSPALATFIDLSPWLLVLSLLLTLLTLLPILRAPAGASGHTAAWLYLGAGALLAAAFFAGRPLAFLENKTKALAIGLAAAVPTLWLAWIDHRTRAAEALRAAAPDRLLAATLWAAIAASFAYAVGVAFRITTASGAGLGRDVLAAAAAWSVVAELTVFIGVFLVLMTIGGMSRLFVRDAGPAEYWVAAAALCIGTTLVVYRLVCAAISFGGVAAWASAIALGLATTALWVDVGRLRGADAVDSFARFCAPVAGRGSRRAGLATLAVLPAIALVLASAVRQFDWSFLLQKLGVIAVWVVAFSAAYAAVGDRPRRRSRTTLAAVPLAVIALFRVADAARPDAAIARYAGFDPSVRLLRDARVTHSSETAEYYAFLRSHTLMLPRRVPRGDIDFVKPLPASPRRAPHIFLIVVDSLRRDYLSPYNPRVDFTPAIGRLAAESFVYQRAFTRYAGTGLSVPAIWAGGMVPHLTEQVDFPPRNALLKLLEANGYQLVMSMDSVVDTLLPRGTALTELDKGKPIMQHDLCATLDELRGVLAARDSRPVFFYALPQNAHIAVATARRMPAGEAYAPEFLDRIASSVHRIDACVGGFVESLKRDHLFDDSVIVVTSDHGDSLGEDGRWGHSYFMYPEIMTVPLVIHLPASLRDAFRTDLDRAAFTSDIVPSLYELLGYRPADLGPLFGRSLFTAPEDDVPARGERFLIGASYGAGYGIVEQNGRRMYVVDAAGGDEYAYDLSTVPERLTITPAMTAANRRAIAEQLHALASIYRYQD